MKTTRLRHPLVLAAIVAVTCAAPTPAHRFQHTPTPEETPANDLKNELEAFLEQNPAIAEDLYPDLLNEALNVSLTVDQDVVLSLLKDYIRDETVQEIEDELESEGDPEEEEEEEEEEGEAEDYEDYGIRRKRQTSWSGGIQNSRNPFGQSTSGSLGLNHAWGSGRHSLSGNIGGSKHTIKGLGSANSYSAGVGYNFSPSKKTSLSINAHKNWAPGGSSHGFGLSFSHKFGR